MAEPQHHIPVRLVRRNWRGKEIDVPAGERGELPTTHTKSHNGIIYDAKTGNIYVPDHMQYDPETGYYTRPDGKRVHISESLEAMGVSEEAHVGHVVEYDVQNPHKPGKTHRVDRSVGNIHQYHEGLHGKRQFYQVEYEGTSVIWDSKTGNIYHPDPENPHLPDMSRRPLATEVHASEVGNPQSVREPFARRYERPPSTRKGYELSEGAGSERVRTTTKIVDETAQKAGWSRFLPSWLGGPKKPKPAPEGFDKKEGIFRRKTPAEPKTRWFESQRMPGLAFDARDNVLHLPEGTKPVEGHPGWFTLPGQKDPVHVSELISGQDAAGRPAIPGLGQKGQIDYIQIGDNPPQRYGQSFEGARAHASGKPVTAEVGGKTKTIGEVRTTPNGTELRLAKGYKVDEKGRIWRTGIGGRQVEQVGHVGDHVQGAPGEARVRVTDHNGQQLQSGDVEHYSGLREKHGVATSAPAETVAESAAEPAAEPGHSETQGEGHGEGKGAGQSDAGAQQGEAAAENGKGAAEQGNGEAKPSASGEQGGAHEGQQAAAKDGHTETKTNGWSDRVRENFSKEHAPHKLAIRGAGVAVGGTMALDALLRGKSGDRNRSWQERALEGAGGALIAGTSALHR